MTFRPMLAKEYDPAKLIYPVYASPKLDGIRASVVGGKLLSRSLKPIPNRQVSALLSDKRFEGFDGELIVGAVTAPNVFSNTTSHVMSHDKVFDFTYFVFDLHNSDSGFAGRYLQLQDMIGDGIRLDGCGITLLDQTRLHSHDDLDLYEGLQIAENYEGVILRKIDGVYKYGRSTVNEGLLLKVKRFTDSEAQIIGFEEQLKNNNEATTNELGRTKRSSHQENKSGKGTLGALIMCDVKTGVEFNCGTGMDDKFRQHVWGNQESYLGKIGKYKSFLVGVKDAPRHPVWLGLRSPLDMS